MREFIWNGSGDTSEFLRWQDSAANSSVHPGHCLIVEANPNSIFAKMQFFIGCDSALPQWILRLGPNPSTSKGLVLQASAHFFAYTREADGRFKGGKAVKVVG